MPAHGGGGKRSTVVIGASEKAVRTSRFAGELNAAGGGHIEARAIGDDDARAAGAETLIDCPEGGCGVGGIDEERASVEIEEREEPGCGERAAANPEDGRGWNRTLAGMPVGLSASDVTHDGERRKEVIGGRGREELDERGRGGCIERGEGGSGECGRTAATERRASVECAEYRSGERCRLADGGKGDGRRC